MTEIPILNALIFAIAGILVYGAACAVMVRIAPFDVWKEIVREHNVGAAILAGAVALGLAWIVAATMH